MKFNGIFSRLTALVVLTAFLFVSCPLLPPGPPPVVITPGEGNPRYAYLDLNGNVIETDDFERTLFFVENNKNAEGVMIVSDYVGSEARVVIHNQNNNSTVSMFFRENSNFPYHMIIKQNTETYYAYLSYYKTASSTYNIVFEKDGGTEQMTGLVLNKNIFDVYQTDPDLTDSQNLRLYNITVALGLWGSLYNAFDKPMYQSRSILDDILGGVKAVFRAVAVVATVVATVVAPIVTFINPAAGLLISKVAYAVIAISNFIVFCITELEQEQRAPLNYILVSVKNPETNEDIDNDVEYHIGVGEEVLMEFCVFGADFTDINLAKTTLYSSEYIYEPGNKTNTLNALIYFTVDIERENLPPDSFRIRIKRILDGFIPDGKTAFGFQLHTEKDVHFNDLMQPVEFKFISEENPSIHKNLFVARFCIYPYCPDLLD